MSISKFVRYSGAAAIVAGLFTVAGTVLELNPTPALAWIYLISTLATIVALIGIYLYQKEAAGTLGLAGFAVALLGNLLLFFPNPAIGGSVFALGLVLIGLAILRANTFSKWIPWLWIFAPIFAVFGFAVPSMQAPLFLFGAVASGLGFLGVGTRMWSAAEGV
jgi:hypothetical protein